MALRSKEWKYIHTPNDGEWLFDIAADPYERTNLRATHPDRFDTLKNRALELAAQYHGSRSEP